MSFPAQVLTELRNLVVEAEGQTLNIIGQGLAIGDLAAYKEQVGRLYAYRRVLDFFDVASEHVEKME